MGKLEMPSMSWATFVARAMAAQSGDELRSMLVELWAERDRREKREFPHIRGTCVQLQKVIALVRKRIDEVDV